MGTVYKARHVAFGEMRAIKVIDSHLIHDDESLARFRGEAVLARKLLHPNVVRVEDLDRTEDGRPFIVMEYVVGRSLRDVLRKERGLVQARAVDIVAQACSALAAAHALGILHRDMKPENMMLVPQPDGGEVVKVLDFGLAKVLEGFEGAGQQVSTQTGMVVGTPEYTSPEQAVPAQGLELDGRSDLYSLGVVLYELLTGHLPFVAETPMGMVLQHLQTTPEPPREAYPERGIPEALSALVMKALEKDREARFASADEMRQALLALAPGPTSPVVDGGVGASRRRRAEKPVLALRRPRGPRGGVVGGAQPARAEPTHTGAGRVGGRERSVPCTRARGRAAAGRPDRRPRRARGCPAAPCRVERAARRQDRDCGRERHGHAFRRSAHHDGAGARGPPRRNRSGRKGGRHHGRDLAGRGRAGVATSASLTEGGGRL
jgi:tRNA A-37 threonylcarbamoyl transferase component Bud32